MKYKYTLLQVTTLKTHSLLSLLSSLSSLFFSSCPQELSVEPNQGFLILLPNETVTIHISFSPNSAIPYNMDLVLQTSMNDTYVIKVSKCIIFVFWFVVYSRLYNCIIYYPPSALFSPLPSPLFLLFPR